MNNSDCGRFRELIPDVAAGRADAATVATTEAHFAACEECSLEFELARDLFSARSRAPEGLVSEVLAAIRRDRVGPSRSWWGLSAAAVAALAVGIGISSDPSISVPVAPEYATELEQGDIWSSDDGLLAGAPALDELSDEALEALLDELVLGGAGGSV